MATMPPALFWALHAISDPDPQRSAIILELFQDRGYPAGILWKSKFLFYKEACLMRCCPAFETSIKIFLIPLAALVISAAATGAAGSQTSPTAVVQKLNTALLAAMKGGKQLGFKGRYALLKPVVEDVFDVRAITRISVGRQWRGFSPQQHRVLDQLYSKWSAASYASNFNEYDGQRFEIESVQIVGNKADVNSSLVNPDGENVQFLYKLAQSGGAWRIVDIHIKGVSQLSLTRAQFTSILKRNGYEGLVQSLQEKIKELGCG
jgi:phospholipid transport system substrate-binding protein